MFRRVSANPASSFMTLVLRASGQSRTIFPPTPDARVNLGEIQHMIRHKGIAEWIRWKSFPGRGARGPGRPCSSRARAADGSRPPRTKPAHRQESDKTGKDLRVAVGLQVLRADVGCGAERTTAGPLTRAMRVGPPTFSWADGNLGAGASRGARDAG